MIPGVWYRCLQLAIAGLLAFGASMLLLPDAIRQFFGVLLYASPAHIETRFGAAANDYVVLVHGVLGAVMVGWGVAMLLVLRGPFRRGEREGWLLIAVPLAAWYLPDTLFSLCTGFWQNAVLNSVLAAMFAVPLAATRKHFTRGA